MNSTQPAQLLQFSSMLVACLCADWCGACREYKPLFDTLARKFPNVRFLWVDVEDKADLIDPIEVEDFPTILIATGAETSKQPLFFGTVLPHIETLERLIQDKLSAVCGTQDGSSAAVSSQLKLDPALAGHLRQMIENLT